MPEEKTVIVPAPKAYTRTIHKRLVSFTCKVCGKEYTVEQYPGPKPTVCLNCWPEYRRQQKAAAQRRRRARLRVEG